MANTFDKRTLVDGSQIAVVHALLKSDGSSGEITDGVLVDVSALSPACKYVSIEKIDWALSGFDVLVEFDATADSGVLELEGDYSDHKDFRSFGGLTDPKASGFTGDVVISTAGFTAAGDNGHIIIQIRKHY